MALFPRRTAGPSFLYSRAAARWIAAALTSLLLLVGFLTTQHRAGYVFPSPRTWTTTTTPNAPAATFGPPTPLPAWISTPAPFTTTGPADADGFTPTAAIDRALYLPQRLSPAVVTFLERPVLEHDEARAENEARCPRAQLDAQVNQDQLRDERARWLETSAANVTAMRRAAVAFLERVAAEEGGPALLGPGEGVEVGSRGVVIAAGNKQTVERAVACVKQLQSLGWHGGVEVWHFEGELEGEAERGALVELGVAVRMVEIKKMPGQWKNFELKAEAVLRSSFDEVLFLDSDNFPLADVEAALFEAPLFADPAGGRAVFWPDLNRDHPDNAIHRVLGVPCHEAWQLDSGQMLIAKSGNGGLNLAALYLASYMATEGGYWFSGGDKDTFRYAFLALGLPYTPAPRWLALLGQTLHKGSANEAFCGTTMLQYGLTAPSSSASAAAEPADPAHPAPLFAHANLLKHQTGVRPGDAFPQMRRLALAQDDVRVAYGGGGGGPLDRVVGGGRDVRGRGLCSDVWAFAAGAVVETVDAAEVFGGVLGGFEERYRAYGGRAGW